MAPEGADPNESGVTETADLPEAPEPPEQPEEAADPEDTGAVDPTETEVSTRRMPRSLTPWHRRAPTRTSPALPRRPTCPRPPSRPSEAADGGRR